MGEQWEKEKKAEEHLSGILIKISTREKKGSGGKRRWQHSGATKLPLDLIQYGSISVFYSPRVCVRERVRHVYVNMCTTVCKVCPQARERYRVIELST